MPRKRGRATLAYEYIPDYATSQYVPPGERRPRPGDYAAGLALLVVTVLTEQPYKIALPFPKRMLREGVAGTRTLSALAEELAEELAEGLEEALPTLDGRTDAARGIVVTIDRETIRAVLETALPVRSDDAED